MGNLDFSIEFMATERLAEPVPTTVYTPDTYTDPRVREVLEQTSRQALIFDPASCYLGVNIGRIIPNDNAVAIMGIQKGDEAKGTWAYRFAHSRPEGGVGLRGGGGAGTGHMYRSEGEGDDITNRMLPTTEDDSWVKVIGRAVLANPAIVASEITRHGQRGFDNSPARIMIDGHSFLAWDAHKERDIAEERIRGAKAVGTTKSGVGPAASDYAGRVGMHFGMLRLPAYELQQAVFEEVERNNRILKALESDVEYDPQAVYVQMSEYAHILAPYTQNTHATVVKTLQAGNFVFEGAQAFGIGRDTGLPGQVTSTNCDLTTLRLNYCTSADYVRNKIGVMKLVSTSVGNHINHAPLPDAIASALYQRTKERGAPEEGAVSGRQRIYNWTSIPEARAAIDTYGINQVVISKMDTADPLAKIQFGMRYVFPDGTTSDIYDPDDPRMKDPRTRMDTLEINGWRKSTADLRDLQDAPTEMLGAIRLVSHLLGVPVIAAGTGPDFGGYAPVKNSIFDRQRNY